MKRLCAFLFAVLMVCSSFLHASAASETATIDSGTLSNLEQLEKYAYLNLQEADITMRTMILEARKEIIFSKSWVADGVNGQIVDSQGNVLEVLPSFYELFPADWEIPVVPYPSDLEDISQSMNSADPASVAATGTWNRLYQQSLLLKNPSSYVNTDPFYTVSTTCFPDTVYEYSYKYISTVAFNSDGLKYNVGYTNATRNSSLGYATNLSSGDAFQITPPKDIKVAIRASTYSYNAYWSVQVDAYTVG